MTSYVECSCIETCGYRVLRVHVPEQLSIKWLVNKWQQIPRFNGMVFQKMNKPQSIDSRIDDHKGIEHIAVVGIRPRFRQLQMVGEVSKSVAQSANDLLPSGIDLLALQQLCDAERRFQFGTSKAMPV